VRGRARTSPPRGARRPGEKGECGGQHRDGEDIVKFPAENDRMSTIWHRDRRAPARKSFAGAIRGTGSRHEHVEEAGRSARERLDSRLRGAAIANS
jgi:hypothetical protein